MPEVWYTCMDCGHKFRTPKTLYEPYEAYGIPFCEPYTVCPHCFGYALERTELNDAIEKEEFFDHKTLY